MLYNVQSTVLCEIGLHISPSWAAHKIVFFTIVKGMNAVIFISYRRDDSLGSAGRLYDRLLEYFPSERIFMDVDVIEPGQDFVEVIENAVHSCDVVLAIIGSRWLDLVDNEGNRRLDLPKDFVRVEIVTALNSHIRVIPVLVQGATMPRPSDLPDDLKPLSRRNAIEIRHTNFNADTEKLIRILKKIFNEVETNRKIEAERIAAEKAKQEQIEIEKKEAKRLAAERIKQERVALIKAKSERIARENAENERKRLTQVRAERRLEFQRRITYMLPTLVILVVVIGVAGLLTYRIFKIPKIISTPVSAQAHTTSMALATTVVTITPSASSPMDTPVPTNTPFPTLETTPTLVAIQETLFEDNFEDGDANQWHVGSGTWEVVKLEDGNHVFRGTGNSLWGNTYIGSQYWNNYALEARVKPIVFEAGGSGNYIGIDVMVDWDRKDTCQRYASHIDRDDHVYVGAYGNGCNENWDAKYFFSQEGRWYLLRLETFDEHLRFYIDNRLIVEYQDQKIANGYVGLTVGSDIVAYFDDVRVFQIGE